MHIAIMIIERYKQAWIIIHEPVRIIDYQAINVRVIESLINLYPSDQSPENRRFTLTKTYSFKLSLLISPIYYYT